MRLPGDFWARGVRAVLAPPLAFAISRMEEALNCAGWLETIDARVVWMVGQRRALEVDLLVGRAGAGRGARALAVCAQPASRLLASKRWLPPDLALRLPVSYPSLPWPRGIALSVNAGAKMHRLAGVKVRHG